jgi:hypothetical protein
VKSLNVFMCFYGCAGAGGVACEDSYMGKQVQKDPAARALVARVRENVAELEAERPL